jgi:hypothetical protein
MLINNNYFRMNIFCIDSQNIQVIMHKKRDGEEGYISQNYDPLEFNKSFRPKFDYLEIKLPDNLKKYLIVRFSPRKKYNEDVKISFTINDLIFLDEKSYVEFAISLSSHTTNNHLNSIIRNFNGFFADNGLADFKTANLIIKDNGKSLVDRYDFTNFYYDRISINFYKQYSIEYIVFGIVNRVEGCDISLLTSPNMPFKLSNFKEGFSGLMFRNIFINSVIAEEITNSFFDLHISHKYIFNFFDQKSERLVLCNQSDIDSENKEIIIELNFNGCNIDFLNIRLNELSNIDIFSLENSNIKELIISKNEYGRKTHLKLNESIINNMISDNQFLVGYCRKSLLTIGGLNLDNFSLAFEKKLPVWPIELEDNLFLVLKRSIKDKKKNLIKSVKENIKMISNEYANFF